MMVQVVQVGHQLQEEDLIGTDSIVRTNNNVIAENLTVGPSANNGAEFTNGMSAGPISIRLQHFTVTVESGAAWSVR